MQDAQFAHLISVFFKFTYKRVYQKKSFLNVKAEYKCQAQFIRNLNLPMDKAKGG